MKEKCAYFIYSFLMTIKKFCKKISLQEGPHFFPGGGPLGPPSSYPSEVHTLDFTIQQDMFCVMCHEHTLGEAYNNSNNFIFFDAIMWNSTGGLDIQRQNLHKKPEKIPWIYANGDKCRKQ